MRPVVIGAVILGGFWLYNNGYLDSILGSVAPEYVSTGSGDPVTEFATDDPEMNAAETAARASFPIFLANTTDENGAGIEAAVIKVAFPVAGEDNSEVIWVGAFKQLSDTEFTGILFNQPDMMGGLNQGDMVNFSSDMVSDWSFVDESGALFGNYTTRVMLPGLDEQQRRLVSPKMSSEPIPADWN